MPAGSERSEDRVAAAVDADRMGQVERVGAVLESLYPDLRRLAAAYLRRERPGQTIQPTALVHDVFVRLAGARAVSWENRAHFCAIAAHAMRQILVERARAKHAAKRGAGAARLTLDDREAAAPAGTLDALDILALHTALDRLAELDPDRARLVELRYFGGLTVEETAHVLGLSPATIKRSWALARAWLQRELAGCGEEGSRPSSTTQAGVDDSGSPVD